MLFVLILVLVLAFVLVLGLILVHGLTCLQGRLAFIKDPTRQLSFFTGFQGTHACINSPSRDPSLRHALQQSPRQLGVLVRKQMEEFRFDLRSTTGFHFRTSPCAYCCFSVIMVSGFIWMFRSSPLINKSKAALTTGVAVITQLVTTSAPRHCSSSRCIPNAQRPISYGVLAKNEGKCN